MGLLQQNVYFLHFKYVKPLVLLFLLWIYIDIGFITIFITALWLCYYHLMCPGIRSYQLNFVGWFTTLFTSKFTIQIQSNCFLFSIVSVRFIFWVLKGYEIDDFMFSKLLSPRNRQTKKKGDKRSSNANGEYWDG